MAFKKKANIHVKKGNVQVKKENIHVKKGKCSCEKGKCSSKKGSHDYLPPTNAFDAFDNEQELQVHIFDTFLS
jgi:hypothetical protein